MNQSRDKTGHQTGALRRKESTMLTLTNGAVVTRTVSAKERKSGVIEILEAHNGKSGNADGRLFRCTLHVNAGGADDGAFRAGGIAWHATKGGCDIAADALNLPVEARAAAKTRRSPDEQRQAMVEQARAKALNQ